MDSTNSAGFSSLPNLSASFNNDVDHTEDLPDPDEGLVLFPEDDQDHSTTNHDYIYPDCSDVTKKHLPNTPEEVEYILGTIIIRVVAARGLENPNKQDNGIGFGGVFRNSMTSASNINPYASVKFGNSTQRTSELYSTLDPVWARDEVFFMDVSLPVSQLTHPSEPSLSEEIASSSSSSLNETNQNASALLEDPYSGYNKPDNTTLTVAIFHTEMGHVHSKQKLHNEGALSGDSDDTFLGMASIDLIRLFTGKVSVVDEWLPLNGTSSDIDGYHKSDYQSLKRQGNRGASVRIICEYELSDVPPKSGDICRFTRFCHPKDLYPLEPACSYKVDQVHNNGEIVLLSYESQERWILSFQAHKNMLICEERHVSALNTAQDELQTLGERLSASPLVGTVTETVERVVDDGLVGVAEGIVRGSAFVFDRWFKGGIDTVIRDLQDITNLDGRHNTDTIGQHLGLESRTSSSSSLVSENNENSSTAITEDAYQEKQVEALPNMPPCPITGFPMVDPVVAADGHTYERSAIARWLKTSDKSPMTGSVLLHKEVVPNYGLMSSVQEAADREEKDASSSSAKQSSVNIIDGLDRAASAGNLADKKPPPDIDRAASAGNLADKKSPPDIDTYV